MPFKVIAFNANGIWRRRYELSKQLQNLHIQMYLCSERDILNPMKDHLIQITTFFFRTDRFPGRKGVPHNHVDLCYVYV
jgi:uncharacterized protein YlaI